MAMWSKDFNGWNSLKQDVDERGSRTFFKVRDVWFCSVGVNIGSEQDGHNELFERPVLIVKGFSTDLFWGMSLSSKLKPENPYYFPYRHNGVYYSAIISQLRLFDAKRLVRKLYSISPASFQEIQLRLIEEIATIGIKSDPLDGGPRNPKVL